MSNDQPLYEVGYKKPPQNSQFTKGTSGNPKGRPKGSKNLATIFLRESRQRVRVKGPDGTRAVTKLEAAAMQLGNRAAQGDLRSQREFFTRVQWSKEAASSAGNPTVPPEADKDMMQSLVRRMQEIGTTESTRACKLEEKES